MSTQKRAPRLTSFDLSYLQGGQAMGVKGMFRSDFSQTCYSHHQKTVILDAPGGADDSRRIIAFVGSSLRFGIHFLFGLRTFADFFWLEGGMDFFCLVRVSNCMSFRNHGNLLLGG